MKFWMKYFNALALVFLTMLVFNGTARANFAMEELDPRKSIQADWQALNIEEGDSLPVYGAPFEDAWRGAEGEAAIDPSENFTLLGSAQDGTWLLAEYSEDPENGRIGWIRNPLETAPVPAITMDRTLCEVVEACEMTDDPFWSRRSIRTLPVGEKLIAMFTIRGASKQTNNTSSIAEKIFSVFSLDGGEDAQEEEEWACVETEVDGKAVWGFVPSGSIDWVPAYTVEGDTLTILDHVTMLGEIFPYAFDEEWKETVSAKELLAAGVDPETCRPGRILPGEIWEDGLDFTEEPLASVRKVVLPESIRILGTETLHYSTLDEFKLPGSLAYVDSDVFYISDIGKLVIAEDYQLSTLPLFGDYNQIRAWEVEQGNPLYRSQDGVLFSADGETLIRYPEGKAGEHYDVPKGTVEIGAHAFYSIWNKVPLRTISLPVGLKRIGERAFEECVWLQSMVVPLTVTEMDPYAFASCISLERLSLPEGLKAYLGDDALASDFTYYTGDNGTTFVNFEEE